MSRVAVCICTCDRATLLARVLAAVERIELHDLPAENVLLIVVDNRADGRRGRCACACSRKLPIALRFIEEPAPGISFARNRATAEACDWGADFVAFLDDDDVPRPDWLWQLAPPAARDRGGPRVRLLVPARRTCTCRTGCATRAISARREREDRNRYGLPAWAGTYNVLVARRVLDRPGAAGRPVPSRVRPLRRRGQRPVHPRQGSRTSAMPAPTNPSSCAHGSRIG